MLLNLKYPACEVSRNICGTSDVDCNVWYQIDDAKYSRTNRGKKNSIFVISADLSVEWPLGSGSVI